MQLSSVRLALCSDLGGHGKLQGAVTEMIVSKFHALRWRIVGRYCKQASKIKGFGIAMFIGFHFSSTVDVSSA